MAKDGLRFLNLDPSSPVDCTCDILDKEKSTFDYVQYMFDRTNRMFKYTGLPDTIPAPIFEYMLQIYGSVAIIEHNDNIYAMRANFGGPPDPYYRPTQAVIANPALAISGMYRIWNHLPPFDVTTWKDYPPCIRFLNDSQIMGLVPLFTRYAVQMTENDISIRSAQINSRQQVLIAADSGPDIESANLYMKHLEAGTLAAIQKRALTDGISVFNGNSGQSNNIIQLIELQQYLKASWYNEIGLNSNFNMKRQYVSSEEINSTADIMLPLIDNLYNARVTHCEDINRLFGTHITVEKDSAWAKKQMQSDLSVSQLDTPDLIVPDSTVQSTEPDSESVKDETNVVDTAKPSTNPELVAEESISDAVGLLEAISESIDTVVEAIADEGGDNYEPNAEGD